MKPIEIPYKNRGRKITEIIAFGELKAEIKQLQAENKQLTEEIERLKENLKYWQDDTKP